MSTGRSFSRSTKSSSRTAVAARANSAPRNQSREKGEGAAAKAKAVDFVPLTVTHTMSKPSPSRSKLGQQQQQQQRVTSGSAKQADDKIHITPFVSRGTSCCWRDHYMYNMTINQICSDGCSGSDSVVRISDFYSITINDSSFDILACIYRMEAISSVLESSHTPIA